MFASLMQRLEADGVEVKTIAGMWFAGSPEKSVNYHECLKNLREKKGPKAAAKDTWAGRIVRKYGYVNVTFGERGD